MKTMVPLRFRLNGQECRAEVDGAELLIDFIRDRLGLTGTKRSCDMEICGACTVLLDGKAISSCSVFAFEVDGKDLLTIEGLAGREGIASAATGIHRVRRFSMRILYARHDLVGEVPAG